jgi:type II secretory pathway pseudopilin PulG
MSSAENTQVREGEQGFLLVGVVVLVFLALLALSVAAPKVAKELRREREVEAIHRGNEYMRAIRLYYLKFGRYPGTMDQLEKSANYRFLRKKYTDPLTNKADWKLIHIGEAKTTVKGFFGQPLAGLPSGAGGLGAASSMVSGQQGGTVGGAPGSTGFGSSSGSGLSGSQSSSGFSLGSGSSFGSTSGSSTSPGSTPSPGGTVSSSSSSSGSSSGIGGQSATSFTGGGAPIVGIGCSHSGSSITVLNEQTTYQTWEFIYDPRIEQLKAKAALLGGGASSGFGSGSGSSFGSGSSSGFGSSPNSGFGSSSPSSPSSGFGSGSGSGFGSGSSGGSTPSTSPR